jgi:hypothetical protein
LVRRYGQDSRKEPATDEFRDSDDAWAEVVAAGLITVQEAETQRADGYQGVRVEMTTDGTWQKYSAGSD